MTRVSGRFGSSPSPLRFVGAHAFGVTPLLRVSGRSGSSPSPLRCYVALGTNLGDRLLNLAEARRRLAQLGAHLAGPVLETDALLPPEDSTPQPKYLNSVDQLDTTLGALPLFHQLKAIERQMGRVSTTRWAPRIIDLDLILFGDVVLQGAELTVPHPAMHQRRFVLAPLAALAPGALHPLLGRTASELLADSRGPRFGAR